MNYSVSAPIWKSVDLAKQFFVSISENVPFFVALAVTAGVLSICPANFLSSAKDWRWLFVSLSLFAVVYLIAHRWGRYYIWRQTRWQLKHIGADEREVLKQYVLEDKSCGYFGIKHGAVANLIA